jgi:hypothetical protein
MSEALNVVDCFTMTVGVGVTTMADATPPLINGKMSGKTVRRMIFSVSDDAISWRGDGTDPTGTVGHIVGADESVSLTGANYKSLISAIKFIRVTGDAKLFGTCFD